MSESGVLGANRRKAITALLACATIKEAAKRCGLGERTLTRYLADPAFKAELSRRQGAILASVTASLVGLSGEAVAVLREVLRDPDASHAVKVRAALGWLRERRDSIELQDLAERVGELERQIGGKR
jgi:hypothetical protein